MITQLEMHNHMGVWLTQAKTWVNLENSMPGERSQTLKITYYIQFH